jgi:hypothetical protein
MMVLRCFGSPFSFGKTHPFAVGGHASFQRFSAAVSSGRIGMVRTPAAVFGL